MIWRPAIDMVTHAPLGMPKGPFLQTEKQPLANVPLGTGKGRLRHLEPTIGRLIHTLPPDVRKDTQALCISPIEPTCAL